MKLVWWWYLSCVNDIDVYVLDNIERFKGFNEVLCPIRDENARVGRDETSIGCGPVQVSDLSCISWSLFTLKNIISYTPAFYFILLFFGYPLIYDYQDMLLSFFLGWLMGSLHHEGFNIMQEAAHNLDKNTRGKIWI